MFLIYYFSLSLHNSRSKRETPTRESQKNVMNNLFVKLLVVIDSTVYDFFRYQNFEIMGDLTINDYIKIFFCHVINGVNITN